MAEKESIVDTAKRRYQRARDAYSDSRRQAIEDTRFVLGDSENRWQWPEDVYSKRAEVQGKPCLTINVTAQHCNQVINNIRQNRPAGRVLPVDSTSDPDTAEILGGLIRSIQSQSQADTAHDIAAEHAIYGGEGYWRILTEYESDESFDQTICIKPVTNPQLVYIDPDAIAPDRSDAKWGFVFEDVSPEQAKEDYPGIDVGSWAEDGDLGWYAKDSVRIAEYFWCEPEEDTLLLLADGTTVLKSQLQGATVQAVKERPVQRKRWYWCKLIGGETEPYEQKDWPGQYLPIVAVVGKEINVNGRIVRKGIVRDLKDAARIVNYSYSAAVESIALQNKVPYLASSEAIEGFEDIWQSANIENRAYLPWNAYGENGEAFPKPERQQPATMPTAQVQMLQLSIEEMRAARGQQNANFGIKSEAASGIGIQRLKAQGEIATFHFPDNLSRALTYEMRVLIDLIPRIYDTRRIVRILGLDGKESKAMLEPDMPQPYAETPGQEADEVNKIFNPLMGRYDVTVDTGPSYHTQRQEASEAMLQLSQANPALMQVAGDIVVRSFDFPMANELAKRLEKTLPPGLKEDKNAPQLPPEVQAQMQQADQQVQQLDGVIQKMTDEMQKLEEAARAADLRAQQAQARSLSLQMQIERDAAIKQIEEAQGHESQEQGGGDIELLKQQQLDERERMKVEMQQSTELQKEAMRIAGQIEIARINSAVTAPDAPTAGNEANDIMMRLMETQQALLETISRPKVIVRDAEGRALGIQ